MHLRKSVRIGAVLALAMPLMIWHTSAADWSGWRGPARNGISPETNLNWDWGAEGPRTLWKAKVGKGFSSLTVARGRVFAMGNQDETDSVICLDAATGSKIWTHAYACALDPKSFEGGPLSTPAVDDDRVYTLSKFGHAFCLEAATGKIVWARKFEPPTLTKADYHVWWGFAGSPVVLPDRLLLPVATTALAVDKATGEILWSGPPGHPGYSTPTLFEDRSGPGFALVSGHEIVAANTRDGRVRWTLPWKTTWDQNASDVIISDSRMLVSTGHDVGAALYDFTGPTPAPLWRNKNMRTFLGNPVLWRGHVYGFDDKQLRCVEWNTGEVRWTAPDLGLGALILADRKLVALTEKGTLMAVEATPEAYRLVASAQVLGGRCWSTPALAEGRVFLRNAAGDVVCVDLRKRG